MITKSPDLKALLSSKITLTNLQNALSHSDAHLMVSTYLALESISPCYVDNSDDAIVLEVKLWKQGLPYIMKSCDRGCTTQLMKCLTRLLVRLSTFTFNSHFDLFHNFVIDFLIKDLACCKGAYPGSVLDREMFALTLLRVVFTFALDANESYKRRDPKKGMKTSGVSMERNAENGIKIMELLTSNEVVMPLFTMLDSNWDGSRIAAYELIRDIFRASLKSELNTPCLLNDPVHRSEIEKSALELCLSPRQRESDTGSRKIAILYLTDPTKDWFPSIKRLTERLREKLDELEPIVDSVYNPISSKQVTTDLPLAHGLVSSLQLISEEARHTVLVCTKDSNDSRELAVYFDGITHLVCRALNISLKVVAEDKVTEDGENEEMLHQPSSSGIITLNVNAVIPGLNSIDTKVKSNDIEEQYDSIQRIVVGCWLLLKDACAAIATVFASYPSIPPSNLVTKTGEILIRALLTLKHQGGVFAAHKALQSISESCCTQFAKDSTIQGLPSQWLRVITSEIQEKVRNSTLRRSTGYSLGVLSMLRTEPIPKILCPLALASLVRLSLPSASTIEALFSALSCDPTCFVFLTKGNREDPTTAFVSDKMYEVSQ